MMLKRCIDCGDAYEPDDFETRCDSCSIKHTPSTESELTSVELRIERDRIDEWDRERIKQDWKQAAADSRAAIIAKHSGKQKRVIY